MDLKEDTTGSKIDLSQGRDFNAAYAAIYDDLRKRPSRLRRINPNVTLLITEIVKQTYVHLRPLPDLQWTEIPHFKSIVVMAMRHLMVDLARKTNG